MLRRCLGLVDVRVCRDATINVQFHHSVVAALLSFLYTGTILLINLMFNFFLYLYLYYVLFLIKVIICTQLLQKVFLFTGYAKVNTDLRDEFFKLCHSLRYVTVSNKCLLDLKIKMFAEVNSKWLGG